MLTIELTTPGAAGRRIAMATESIGQTVYLTDEMADRIIEAMEEVRVNPPKPRTRKTNLVDPDEILSLWKKEDGYEK